jgi:DNA ligase-associated metallophosphoesterase
VSNHNQKIFFAGHEFILDPAGTLFWVTEEILIFSDLHFEKGSYFVSKGNPLPTYDTLHTLEGMETLICAYKPRQVICLGDNLHDAEALARMSLTDFSLLQKIHASVNQWLWIIGNHDKIDYATTALANNQYLAQKILHNIILTHDYQPINQPQIIGHFHPKKTINIHGQTISGKCFVVSDNLLVMPAFGSYTGGLDIQTAEFQTLLLESNYSCYLLQRDRVWQIK